MAQRVLVMNGQRLLQSERDGKWSTDKVDKANQLKPGVYSLDAARPAAADKTHQGVIVHADRQAVYQQVGMALVRHGAAAFDAVPQPGVAATIAYADGRASVQQAARAMRHGVKR